MFHYLSGMMAPGNIPLPGTIPPYAGLVKNILQLKLHSNFSGSPGVDLGGGGGG